MKQNIFKPVLITGANGFVGRNLIEALVKEESQVIAMVRSKIDSKIEAHRNIQVFEANFENFETKINNVPNFSTLVHVAGRTTAVRKENVELENIQMAKSIRKYLTNSDSPKHVIIISSQAAAGPAPDTFGINESDPENPVSVYGRSKLEADEIILSSPSHHRVTILRPVSIYGPWDTSFLKVFQMAKKGTGILPGNQSYKVQLIHVYDFVNAIITTIKSDNLRGKYFVNYPETINWPSVYQMLSEKFDRKIRIHYVPTPIIQIAGYLNRLKVRITNTSDIFTEDKAKEIIQPFWICNSNKFQKETGWKPELNVFAGMEQTLNWYKKSGWI